ncbi:two-component system response regulator HsbR [Alteromonas sp. D210916BOD_24]|uniref:ATP-binding SpoIIE family protein phosphatase n=1 Tax=Alteromonas sp. D210916BOD_24 TaxID=3157618 RepID=UPI00399CBDC5
MKILIVDDEAINRELLLNMLQKAGYETCVVAENGEQAISQFTKERPDLVLLDVIMPGLSGFDVAAHIRKHDDGAYLPILFITALEDKESLVQCLDVGGNDFATKPFDRHILIAKIRAHLKIRALSKYIEHQNQTLRVYQQRVAREHAIVKHIFSHAIVNNPQALAHFDYCLKPAETFNGDLFLCEPSPSGGIYFLVGDFTGHGLASAIGALPVTLAFQALSRRGSAVAEFVSELNKILLRFLPSDMFMAAVIGEINGAGDKVRYWQGGMPALIVTAQSPSELRCFPSRHMALGILEENELDTECDTIKLSIDQQLIVYSDGLIENANAKNQMLLEEGFLQLVAEQQQAKGKVSADFLFQQVKNHSEVNAFDDDVTLVIFNSKSINVTLHDQLPGLPSSHEILLEPQHLKQPDILQRVLQLAGTCEGIERVRSIIYTVLSELFNNALEHGLLHLDSSLKASEQGFRDYYALRANALRKLDQGYVRVCITSQPTQQQILISVEDSGKGFEWAGIQSSSDEASYGRGLALLHTLSNKMWFDNDGRKVSCLLDTRAL